MSDSRSVSLGSHFDDFIEAQVRTGRYDSADDVMRAGLRMLEEHEAKLKALRDALIAGEESGPAREFDGEQFLRRMHATHGG